MKVTLTGYESVDSHGSNIYNIGKSIYDKGYLKRLICTFHRNKTDIDENLIIKEPLPLSGIRLLLSMSWHHISRKIPERYYNEILFDMFSQRYILDDSDVLLCTDSGLIRSVRKAKRNGIFIIILHRTLHPEVIYEVLNEESKKFGVTEESVFTNKKWNRNRVTTLEECDAIFVKSNLVKESCIEKGIPKEKIKVISSGVGVNTEYFKPPKKRNDKFVCLFVGHKSLINGVPYLLEAWKMLDLKNAKLVICGVQNRKIIERYSKIVDFDAPGSVSNPLKYYNIASIFVLPSLANSFPRVTLEAMSCGLPVIITEGVGSKDIIKDGKEGFIIPIRDSDSLAEKIQYFYENPEEIKRMGRNARKRAEEYSWRKYGDEVIEKIEDVVR